ncbi:hypothetical protein SGRIM119S_03712 [Streptomyces griseorubiginosus]
MGSWCTGFRPDVPWIDLDVLDGDGEPVQWRGVVEGGRGAVWWGGCSRTRWPRR